MKSLLLLLGISAGLVSAAYTALDAAPWLIWLLPLLACIGLLFCLLFYVRGGWAAEATPTSRPRWKS